MPTLRIQNLTTRRLVFDGVVGAIGPEKTKDTDISVSTVEALRPSLLKMQNAGIISFNHFNIDNNFDDDTEFVTLEDIRLRISNAVGPSGSPPATGTVPLTGVINGANSIFTSAIKWIRTATLTERLYYNGVRITEGIGNDYIASESVPATGYDVITMTFPPIPGDVLTIDFYPI